MMKRLLLSLALLLSVTSVNAAPPLSLEELLNRVQAGRIQDNKEAAARETRFRNNKAQRQSMLNDTIAERARQEQRSERLEAAFKKNEEELNALRERLAEELGDLKELFGVIQQTAGEAEANFKTSITSAQYAGRSEKLSAMAQKMGQSNELISMEDIENLWFELQREMTEQGKVVRFSAPVSEVSGEKEDRSVTRVGVFNVVSDGKFLNYTEGTGLSELARQPKGRYLSQAEDLEDADAGDLVSFSLDPTQGQLLGALVESPGLFERINQGGVVGYIIILMGLIALVIAIRKIIDLTAVEKRVNIQAQNVKQASVGNPLGRILKVYHDNPKSDPESMELKLGEAIMKETPKLNSWLMFLKIIAVVAPLMGLLGTVTGMIQTFQSITLFGSGDPKLMAGGISQALVTTVLGLCVAIPTVLLHTAASARAKRIQEVLEEQSAGMIAEQVERHSKKK